MSPHGFRTGNGDPFDGILHRFPAFCIQAPQGPAHFHKIRDHVGGFSAMDASYGHNCRVSRVIFTGYDRLELRHYVSADGDRIDAVFRMSAMSALSFDLDIKEIIGRVCRSLF